MLHVMLCYSIYCISSIKEDIGIEFFTNGVFKVDTPLLKMSKSRYIRYFSEIKWTCFLNHNGNLAFTNPVSCFAHT